MKLTKAILQEYKIFNPHNLCSMAGSKLYINYSPEQLGRDYQNVRWQVIGMNILLTDPHGAWYNYGNKTFDVFSRESKQPNLEKAIAWCKETYGITEWERDVFGCYQIKGTLDKIATMIKENK